MRLSILIFDGLTVLDAIGGYEVLSRIPGVEVEFVAAQRGIVAADTRRLGLLAYRDFSEVQSTDILYVPGGPGARALESDPEFIDYLRLLDSTSSWTIGICMYRHFGGIEYTAKSGATQPFVAPDSLQQASTAVVLKNRIACRSAKGCQRHMPLYGRESLPDVRESLRTRRLDSWHVHGHLSNAGEPWVPGSVLPCVAAQRTRALGANMWHAR